VVVVTGALAGERCGLDVNKEDSVLMNNKRQRLEGPGGGTAGDKQRGGEGGRRQGTGRGGRRDPGTTRETRAWGEGHMWKALRRY